MERIPKGWDVIEPQRVEGEQILEPENPAAQLLELIDKAPNSTYGEGDERNNKVAKRREEIRSCAEHIQEIATDLSNAFVETYAKYGFQIKGGVRFYVVGGRLTSKSLSEGSDLDCAFTVVDDREDMQPRYGAEPKELVERKQAARKEFFFGPFKEIIERHGFTIEEKIGDDVIRAPLLEPKEYGRPDKEFREQNMPAMLVSTTL
jgi:hypothetical protein